MKLVVLSIAILALTTVALPAHRAIASPSSQNAVIASAVVQPARVSRLGFVIAATVREVNVQENDLVKAGDVLVVLDAPELNFAVTAAEAGLRSAQANAELQRYKRVKDRRHGKVYFDVLPPEVIAISDVKVVQAQAALEVAQASLAQAILVAPHDGTVASIHVVPGELVQLGQVVLTLATLDELQIETTDLSERNITRVAVGDPAVVSVEALSTEINGTVVGISPIANRVGGDVVFKVTIAPERQLPGLLWGMTAEVTLPGK